MSGSPKYHCVGLAAWLERQVREERRRRAVEHAALRQAERERRQRARGDRHRAVLKEDLDAIERALASIPVVGHGASLAARICGLRARLDGAKAAVETAASEVALRTLLLETVAIRKDLEHVRSASTADAVSVARSRERAEAEAAVAAALDALAGLKADSTAFGWVSGDVAAIETRLGQLEALVKAGRFDEVRSHARDASQEVEQLVARAEEMQLKDERRQAVVRGILDTLTGLGFVIEAGSPSLDHPTHPASAVIIRAQRLTGEAIAVSVPQDLHERVEYDVAGFPKREETATSGRGAVRTCDEAEAELERMRTELAKLGIESDPLAWEGKDPHRLRREAQDLPSGSAQPRTMPRNS